MNFQTVVIIPFFVTLLFFAACSKQECKCILFSEYHFTVMQNYKGYNVTMPIGNTAGMNYLLRVIRLVYKPIFVK